MSSKIIALSLLLSLSFSVNAAEEKHIQQHGAHEHGVADLEVATAGVHLMVALHSPAHNLLGFEHSPHNKQERKAFNSIRDALREKQPFKVPPIAKCRLVEQADNFDELKKQHEKHSDLDVEWLFRCKQSSELKAIDLKPLFTQYPNLKTLKVKWLKETTQSATTLKAEKSVLHLTAE